MLNIFQRPLTICTYPFVRRLITQEGLHSHLRFSENVENERNVLRLVIR